MRLLNVVHQDSAGPGVFAQVTAERGDTVDVWEPPREDPPAVGDHDAVFVFGGSMHVDQEDEHPWLVRERAWLEELVDRRVPVLGLCLGSQLLAQAAGASPHRADQGEVGWHEVRAVRRGGRRPAAGRPARPLPGLRVAPVPVPAATGGCSAGPQRQLPSGLPAGRPGLGPPVPRRGRAQLDRPLARRGRGGRGRPPARGRGDRRDAGGLERARARDLPALPRRSRGPDPQLNTRATAPPPSCVASPARSAGTSSRRWPTQRPIRPPTPRPRG